LTSIGLIFPIASSAEIHELTVKPLENEVIKILGKNIRCKKMEVQIRLLKEKPSEIKTLAVRFESVVLGDIVADYMTVLYEKPVIDFKQLKKTKEFKILSSSMSKVGILISVKAIEGYLAGQVKKLQKNHVRISIRFLPPYAECLFDTPVSVIDPKILKLLNKYVKGEKLEGYAAFQIKVKDNAISALSSKVIVNHFLIPDTICQEVQNMVNPFDHIPVLSPFRYSINNVNVQNKYLFLTN